MGGRVHPAEPAEALAADGDAELQQENSEASLAPSAAAVLRSLRFHVRHAMFKGVRLEQLFRHFCDSDSGTATVPEITPARLKRALVDLDEELDRVACTDTDARELVSHFSDGDCVLLEDGFRRMASDPASSEGAAGQPLQTVKSVRKMPKRLKSSGFAAAAMSSSGPDDHDAEHHEGEDPLLWHRFKLDRDQAVVQDDPDHIERLIPIEVDDLCDRLAYEADHAGGERGGIAYEQFTELSRLILRLVNMRLYGTASEAFQLYSSHDPDNDSQRTMRARKYCSLTERPDLTEDTRTLNLRLFDKILHSFADAANFNRLTLSEGTDWEKTLTRSMGVKVDWQKDAVEMEMYERGRRFVDFQVDRNLWNLWGLRLPGWWAWISPRDLCSKHKRRTHVFADKWLKVSAKQEQEQEQQGGGGCCRGAWIPWPATSAPIGEPDGPNTFYYSDRSTRRCRWCRWCCDGPLVQRRRVFSRLLVKFRVNRIEKLTKARRSISVPSHEETVRKLAAKHLATEGSVRRDVAKIDCEQRAKEQTSQFVFLKLFKDFPIDETALARPFINPQMDNWTKAGILISFLLGGIVVAMEGVELWQQAPCGNSTLVDCELADCVQWQGSTAALAACELTDREHCETWQEDCAITEQFGHSFTKHQLGVLAAMTTTLTLIIRLWWSYRNRMTAFGEKLVSTLFFRVIDNNRGALSVMLHEAEMQEQREALLCYFFLLFRWCGRDEDGTDLRFERRPEGAAIKRSELDYDIEEWLEAVTNVNVDFDMDDAVPDLLYMGLIEELKGEEAKAAMQKNHHVRGQEGKKIERDGSSSNLRSGFRSTYSRMTLCADGPKYCAAGEPVCTKPVCLLDLLNELGSLLRDPLKAPREVPGLYSFDPQTGTFKWGLYDKGVPYGAEQEEKMKAVGEFTIPRAATEAVGQRLESLKFVQGPIRRFGVSFVAVIRARWSASSDLGRCSTSSMAAAGLQQREREIAIFGVNTYDPGGRTSDSHASEAVGGDCQMFLTAVLTVVSTALMLGADADQVESIRKEAMPIVEKLHGRMLAMDWLVRQAREALLEPEETLLPQTRPVC